MTTTKSYGFLELVTVNNFEYLIVLGLVLLFPFLFSFHKKSYISGQIKSAILAIFTVAPLWILYDVWATSRGHWAFNSDYILGLKIINLPIEEILFFIVVPFSCVFVWTIFRDFTSINDFLNRLKPRK